MTVEFFKQEASRQRENTASKSEKQRVEGERRDMTTLFYHRSRISCKLFAAVDPGNRSIPRSDRKERESPKNKEAAFPGGKAAKTKV